MGRAFDKYLGRNTTLGLALWGPPNILQRSEALLFEHLQMRIVVYHVQILEENIRSMEPEIPKLMAEVANAKKMERAAAAVAGISTGMIRLLHRKDLDSLEKQIDFSLRDFRSDRCPVLIK
ncbi:uncharacterized protein LOC108218361 isoform X1 [Daucus carota subsp. sativus]|uniref:uncharacterized protein LOC108218361 isoform X1 n=1 Tax=Daucus carota subsp. sativus TaxID=79200 RepID=UPI0030837CA6